MPTPLKGVRGARTGSGWIESGCLASGVIRETRRNIRASGSWLLGERIGTLSANGKSVSITNRNGVVTKETTVTEGDNTTRIKKAPTGSR